MVELHDQLVAIDRGDVADAEFLMKHPIPDGVVGHRPGGSRNELAFQGERHTRLAPRRFRTPAFHLRCPSRIRRSAIRCLLVRRMDRTIFLEAAAVLLAPCALPAGRGVAGAEMRHLVEA